ncbi:MAG: hypothetical protein ACYDER_11555 [Ktedonobacteraceae bacterium]
MIRERDIAEQQTGTIYLWENKQYPAQYDSETNLQPPMFSRTSTGNDTQIRSGNQQAISRDMIPYQLLSETTGAELPDCRTMIAVVGEDVASDTILTGYRTDFHVSQSLHARLYQVHFNQSVSLDTLPTTKQVERTREISGLTIKQFIEIYDVSPVTYHKWLKGSPLNAANREHLLEVLPLMEEALQRLRNPQAVSNWLLTPISHSGKKPIDYLKERQYTIFRGFLLHIRTGREKFHPLPLSNRVHLERPREEFEDALEQLRPRTWINEDNKDTSDTPVNDKVKHSEDGRE